MKNRFLFFLCLLTGAFLYAQQQRPGLYAGDNFQGEMDFYDALDWIKMNAQDGGDYSIVLGTSFAASSSALDCNGKSVSIALKTSEADVQITYATRSPSSSLFTVKKGVSLVLENGVELVGRPNASRPPVTVDGGNFIMNGGSIKDSKVDIENWFGGGVDIINGGSFTMNGGRISGNSCSAGGAGINVGENSTFILNDGYIEKNSITGRGSGTGFGGGVFVNKNAVFTMNGGSIKENTATYGNGYGGGGGVYVNGAFTMVDGAIYKNACAASNSNDMHGRGGGVCVSGDGSFIMQNGQICFNADGGVYLSRTGSAKFTMNGGEIILNTGNVAGTGVHVNGTFEMNNGIIRAHSDDKGAGVCVETGTFTMNGGAIRENSAWGTTYSSVGGGGVYVSANGKFIMNDGIIEKNTAFKNATGGGGVFLDGVFIMNGGTISGNNTTKSGGGVFVSYSNGVFQTYVSPFIKSNTAGIIYGSDAPEDKANKADEYGHAVYTKNGSRDTTARKTMALDSTKEGAEGGWE